MSEPIETEASTPSPVWRTAAIGCLLVGGLVMLWILATPPSAGPDEPSHLVRSASLVRGEARGSVNPEGWGFVVPPATAWPPPNCYAFDEFAPASCATSLPTPTGDDVRMNSRAGDYPIWPHLLPGLGTFAPDGIETYVARALDALIPVLLVVASLFAAARRGWLLVGASLLALTPMAWFSFSVVNPSGIVVAGGLAMWIGVVGAARRPDVASCWLIAVGFAALSLPRRDGFVWAGAIVALALLYSGADMRTAWRSLGTGPQVVVGLATTATLLYAVTSDAPSTQFLVLVPLLPVAAVAARWAYLRARSIGTGATVVAVAGMSTVAIGALYAVMSQRDVGFDREVFRIIVNRTGVRLEQAIGALGWLDTPIPATSLLLWVVTLGALVGVAVFVDDRRAVALAAVTVVLAVVGSWAIEMPQNERTGTYYQGRYYLPFLVGVPVVLAALRSAPAGAARVGRLVAGVALLVLNVALAAAMRRWGVGNAGPWVPWSWNTYDTPLPPMVLLVLHAALSAALLWWAHGLVRSRFAVSAASG